MDCPSCVKELVKTTYEEQPVEHCSKCSGYLLQRRSMNRIKTSREVTSEKLTREADRHIASDTTDHLDCPRCKKRMTKQKVFFDERPDESFKLDMCDGCKLIWFDGGELARYQMDYESSEQAVQQLMRTQRLSEMNKNDRADLDRNISRLREHDPSLATYFWQATWLIFPVFFAVYLLVAAVTTAIPMLPFIPGVLMTMVAFGCLYTWWKKSARV